jgi:hypothetical protein
MVCFVEGVLDEAKKWWQRCLRIIYVHVTNERIEPMLCNLFFFKELLILNISKKSKLQELVDSRYLKNTTIKKSLILVISTSIQIIVNFHERTLIFSQFFDFKFF